MARNQVFQSAVDTNTRIELFFNDAASPGDTGWEVDLVDAADNVIRTKLLTTDMIAKLKATTKSDAIGVVTIGTGPTDFVSVGRSNVSSWTVLVGSEEAELSESKTATVIGWLTAGFTVAP